MKLILLELFWEPSEFVHEPKGSTEQSQGAGLVRGSQGSWDVRQQRANAQARLCVCQSQQRHGGHLGPSRKGDSPGQEVERRNGSN